MRKLKLELARLKNQGERSLAAEIEQLIEAAEDTKTVPLSRQFLALAATKVHEGRPDLAHDCIGAAVESYNSEKANEEIEVDEHVVAQLGALKVVASEDAFKFPLPEVDLDGNEFEEASPDTVAEFASLLVNAGFAEEAKAYLSAYKQLSNGEGESAMKMDKKKAMGEIKDFFKKQGNLAMVRAAEEMLDEMSEAPKEPESGESKAAMMQKDAETMDGESKEKMMKAGFMMKAAEEAEKMGKAEECMSMKSMAEEMEKDAKASWTKATADKAASEKPAEEMPPLAADADEKPVLYVDPPTAEEERLLQVAASAAKRGDLRKSKRLLAKAQKMERVRLVAALIKAGDTEMAMDVLEEEEKNGGLDSAPEGGEEVKEADKEVAESMDDSEMPKDETAVDDASKDAELPPAPEEPKEEDVAAGLVKEIQSSVRRKNMKAAITAFTKLTGVEKEVVAAVRSARDMKNKELALEGFTVWREVAKQRLKAEAFLAKAEQEDKVYEEAMEGMEKLEDESQAAEELDKALEGVEDSEAEGSELTDDLVTPPGGVNEEGVADEQSDDMNLDQGEEEEGKEEPTCQDAEDEKEEADGMHYEVLQSLDELKATKVSREALAFTFWEDDSGNSQYYVIQAAGKPIGEIHLADQDNAEDIRAYFCDEQKYTKALAQSCENTNLYEMLKGCRARFYANAVNVSAFAEKMKKDVAASVSGDRTAKLATLRGDFMEAMTVAAEAMNKGVYTNKPNPLKSAFAKVLASYGISHPALAVEAAFKDGGNAFFHAVMDSAAEYLEMPKEAFAHAKRMVEQATNVAHAQASSLNDMDMPIGERLSRKSLPLGSVNEPQEPVQASFSELSDRAQRSELRRKLNLGKKY